MKTKKYEIIELSQSHADYKDSVPDGNFRGYFDGLVCGWMFEFKNKDGKIAYNSVTYYEGTPEEYCQTWLRYGADALFYGERMNGYEPTGRVVFRGYGRTEWCAEERDFSVYLVNPDGDGWYPAEDHEMAEDTEDRFEDRAEALGF